MTEETILRDLNPYQREAVTHYEGPLLIIAGAGSGKTRTITHRIAYLMAHYKVPPQHILGVTFTNKAAEEMKRRVEHLVGTNRTPWIKTFHSTAAAILREQIHHLGGNYNRNFTILDENDSRAVIVQTIKELGYSDEGLSPDFVAAVIERAKDELIGPEEFASRRVGMFDSYLLELLDRIYKHYQRRLETSNALDFADLLRLTVRLFQERLDILNFYRDRFRFLVIDEYQDTNYAQYIFSRLLAEKYENICVVGDDDQSIFSWRGADPTNIFKFEHDFPNCKIVQLKANYRSTARILRAASAVIQNNQLRKPKELIAVRPEGERLFLYPAQDELDEANFVAQQIWELWHKRAVPLNHIAVLYRVNTLSRVLEEALIRWGIPYEIVRGFKFYERAEIKDLLAYLRFLVNPWDDLSLLRILNKPRRGIGEKTVALLQKHAQTLSCSLWEAIERARENSALSEGARKRLQEFADLIKSLQEYALTHRPSELADELLRRTGYLAELQADGVDAEERVGNVREFIGHLKEFEQRGGLREFLEEVALMAEADTYSGEQERVALMTLHSAKGLEFDYVFLVGHGGESPPPCAQPQGGHHRRREATLLRWADASQRESLSLIHGPAGTLRLAPLQCALAIHLGDPQRRYRSALPVGASLARHPRDRLLDHIEAPLQLIFFDHERDEHANDVPIQARLGDDHAVRQALVNDSHRLLGGGLLGRAVFHQFDAHHRPQAAHVPDDLILLLHLLEALAHVPTELHRALKQALFFDDLEYSEGGRTCHGVAHIRPTDGAVPRRVDHSLHAHDGAQRHPRGERLGERHQIGLDAIMLRRVELPRPPDARLDLVGDQDDAVLISQLAQELHKALLGNDKPALPLHRLKDDAGDLVGID
jgi:DNA helicase-2/ATP-dependent DNA helicase PcrA